MIYVGYFTDINGIQWKVELDTDPSGTLKECIDIKLSSTPVVVNIESSDDFFKPLKLSGATIRCWVSDHMMNLFTGSAQGVSCKIYRDSVIFWSGFVSPNIYNQDYRRARFELEVECVDHISVLDYIKYSTDQKTIKSVKDIILKALSMSGMNAEKILVHRFGKDLANLYVNEANFFDEEDQAMTYKEVLESILSYLNLTMYQFGNNVVIFNYRMLKDVDISVNSPVWVEESSLSAELKNIDIIDVGSSMSLTDVYNEVNVIASVYKKGELLSDIFDTYSMSIAPGDAARLDVNTVWSKNTFNTKAQILNYKNSDLELYTYNAGGSLIPQTDNFSSSNHITQLCRSVDYNLADGAPSKLDWKYYIGYKHKLGSTVMQGRKLFTISNKNSCITIQGGYLILDFSIMFSNRNTALFPATFTAEDGNIVRNNKPNVNVLVRVGNRYFTGFWDTNPNSYTITFGDLDTKQYNRWIDCPNTVDYTMGLDNRGFVIKVPDNYVLYGDVAVTFFVPKCQFPNDVTNIFFKNVSLKYANGDNTVDVLDVLGEANIGEDVVYNAVIDNNNVSSLEDINLTTTTVTAGTGISLSNVLEKVNGSFVFLKHINNKIQEHNILDAYIALYKQPNRCIELVTKGQHNLHSRYGIDNGTYYAKSVGYDAALDKSSLTLIEER